MFGFIILGANDDATRIKVVLEDDGCVISGKLNHLLEVLLCLRFCIVLSLSVVIVSCLIAIIVGSGFLRLELVVHLLQELRLVVERFEVELAIKLPL